MAGCEASAPPEPTKTVSKYAQQFIDAEAKLAAGDAMGVLYIHPMRKRACNTMQVRISRKDYNGLEYNWEIADILDVQEESSAPVDRRNIGTHPVFFEMDQDSLYRIDAVSCTAYSKDVTVQYQNFAQFKPTPGRLSYVGDFTQSRLADGVDIYVPSLKLSDAQLAIERDSPALKSLLIEADVETFSFDNFDGTSVSAQQIVDNVERSGDYFTLKQTLESQADEALATFLGYLPDVTTSMVAPRETLKMEELLTYNLDLAFFRQDIREDFHELLEAGKPFDLAREYIYNRLDVVNAERKVPKGLKFQTQAYKEAKRNLDGAEISYERFLKKQRLGNIIGKTLTKDRLNAREAWRSELTEVAFVLNVSFSNRTPDSVRERIQAIMTAYTPAKYKSLQIEFAAAADRVNAPQVQKRRLKRLLASAEEEEAILLQELIASFMSENLQENEDYHLARQRFERNWGDIMRLRHEMRSQGSAE